ncbi:G-type lectin S-receptor-like serine/threonine-protein kinase SD1-1 [Vitis vinifera]|uniref:G-type lectin S-receptor-like serine/threonine-protein kinase SD1-1 n=1 Tax=Vitis vinifera TaxID=29760 RepID=UPI002883388A|nr:G-type lectin S-receptor-like serine/threonine-protein kinase SD1-1 [Vitis vinifera]
MITDAVVPTAFAEFMISQFVSAWMGLFLDCRMNGNYLFGPEDVLGEHHWIAKKGNDIRKGGSGCLIWFGDLIDIREFTGDAATDIYIRMSASELGLDRKKEEDLDLPLFDLAIVASATNNFSKANMIGKGGFGSVYKGILSTGQEIAVKRLSNNSGQRLQEFKNEVILIAKLQHLNLVRLLGCCIAEEERMLIYEYLPNKSLDYIIFYPKRNTTLAWQKRFDIAIGVARVLLYLHRDSRLRIIHRDLKTSNILLDTDLNPKISDFGIVRIFERDQTEAKTERVVGTFGYMSPEYAFYGKFSVKSDVFSMGVLLLEIVSGRKNRGFHHSDHPQNLLGHAWLLWTEDKALELMDQCLKDSCVESQVLRCIQVGLLCVQKCLADRPTMSSVVFMLGNEEAVLPQPKQKMKLL